MAGTCCVYALESSWLDLIATEQALQCLPGMSAQHVKIMHVVILLDTIDGGVPTLMIPLMFVVTSRVH